MMQNALKCDVQVKRGSFGALRPAVLPDVRRRRSAQVVPGHELRGCRAGPVEVLALACTAGRRPGWIRFSRCPGGPMPRMFRTRTRRLCRCARVKVQRHPPAHRSDWGLAHPRPGRPDAATSELLVPPVEAQARRGDLRPDEGLRCFVPHALSRPRPRAAACLPGRCRSRAAAAQSIATSRSVSISQECP